MLRASPRFATSRPSRRSIGTFPEHIEAPLREAYRQKGVEQLYSHQREALDRVENGEDVAVVTPTASGKTLCYNAPVLNRILREPDARALYLFPTKALSRDQRKEILELKDLLGADIRADVYDGDTPGDARRGMRARAHIVITNPDMLHAGILPHHTKWAKLFENLRLIVHGRDATPTAGCSEATSPTCCDGFGASPATTAPNPGSS